MTKIDNGFNYYRDPGHGWCEVPISLLKTLAIDKKVSTFSYIKGANAYLEEDWDMHLFYQTYTAKYQREPTLKESHVNHSSEIRKYQCYDLGIDFTG